MTASQQELEVMLTLQDLSGLLAKVKADPKAYESFYWTFDEMENVVNEFCKVIYRSEDTSMEAADNLKALCIGAGNKSSDMAFACKLNMSGI